MILSYFKPKKSPFWLFLIENWSKIHKIGDYCGKKSSKSEENSKINIYSLVPKIDHLVALCGYVYRHLFSSGTYQLHLILIENLPYSLVRLEKN